jgi:hypothetical protein
MSASATLQRERGVACAEMLVASALFAMVIVAFLLAVDAIQKAYGGGEQIAELHQSARIGLARIVRELRGAGLDPSGLMPALPSPTPIQLAEANRIAFIGDVNGDGATEKVEYRLDPSTNPPTLRRQLWSTWNNGWSGTNGAQPLAERITLLEFTYHGVDGQPIPLNELPSKLQDIRRIRARIDATASPGQSPGRSYRVLAEVRLRNAGL